jgi:hypothetical protein
VDEGAEADEVDVLDELLSVLDEVLDSVDFELADSPSLEPELLRPLADAVEERESVMYQPLPLNTMPTGWMTLRKAPPHCSQVVRGGSEKLWRFSMRSLQAVQV